MVFPKKKYARSCNVPVKNSQAGIAHAFGLAKQMRAGIFKLFMFLTKLATGFLL